jgi:hypothetical protein
MTSSPGRSPGGSGLLKHARGGGPVKLDFDGSGSSLYCPDGARNRQNGCGAACRRSSRCWFSTRGSAMMQQ